uniref:DUF1990 family protein n=1 Tax=Leucobacter sp. BZR 635 TaxID=3378705 RepID=UPI003A8AA855
MPVAYAAIGASGAADLLRFPPAGSTPYEESLQLGSGQERFLTAANLLMTWGAHRAAGVDVADVERGEQGEYLGVQFGNGGTPELGDEPEELFSPEGEAYILPGTTATLTAQGKSARPIMVISTVDEPQRLGFAWGDREEAAGFGEGGLLGLAVSPADAGTQPEHLYAYSTAAGGNRVQRFAITGEPGSLALGDPTTIIDGLPSAASHNGGRIAFGPDGMLYVTAGDAAQPWLSQDLASPGGKILRLAPDGAIPADNPFDGSPVYSYGHRNPQGIAWATDGTMYSSEFGQDTWDELNVIKAGANYGWPEVEGIAGDDRFVDPVQQWRPADASPSGIAILGDTIYIANLRGQRVRTVPLADLAANTDYFIEEYGRIRDVTVSPDGKLWLLSNNTDGRVDPRPDDDRFIDSGLVK